MKCGGITTCFFELPQHLFDGFTQIISKILRPKFKQQSQIIISYFED